MNIALIPSTQITRRLSPRCDHCNHFLSYDEAFKNWNIRQASGVADPEPEEYMWCNACSEKESKRMARLRVGVV